MPISAISRRPSVFEGVYRFATRRGSILPFFSSQTVSYYSIVGTLTRKNMNPAKFIIALAGSALLLAGCRKKATTRVVNSKHVRIGFIGSICEAPVYTAYEKGFFKDEGLEPELVKCSWANYKDNLALCGYDIAHHLVLHFLKPIASYPLTSLLIDHWLEIASESSCLDPLSCGCRTKPVDASSFSN